MIYLFIAIVVFVGYIWRAAYTEEYLDGSHFNTENGEDIFLNALIGVLLGVAWPITLFLYVIYNTTKFIIRRTKAIRGKRNAKANQG